MERYLMLSYQINRVVVLATLLLLSFVIPAQADDDHTAFMLGVSSLDSTLSVYQLGSRGALQQQSFYPTVKNPKAVAMHPSGRFAYVVAKTANRLMSYEVVDTNGRPQLQNPKSYDIPAVSPFALAVHPTGKYLYVAAREGKIAAFSINAHDGELSPVRSSPFDSQYRTRSLVIHPSGEFLYAVNAYANSISAYRIDLDSGVLSPLPDAPFAVTDPKVEIRSLWSLADVPPGAGGIPYYAALDPQGRFLYVSVWGAGLVVAFSIDQRTGSLSELRDSPFKTGLNPYALAVHPSGRYLYAGSWQTNSLWAYSIDQQTGALTALAQKSFPTGGRSPVCIAFNSAGTMAYVANAESASISALRVNRDSGELSLLQTTQTRPGPWWVTQPVQTTTETSRLNLYTFNNKTKSLSLSRLEGNIYTQRIDSMTLPSQLWVAQTRRGVVYAADVKGNLISAYRLEETKHRFVRVDRSPWSVPGSPVNMKIDTNGWYLYVLTKDPNLLTVFGIDSDNADLVPISQPVRLRFAPGELVLDTAARYAYVFSADGREVSLFSYRQNTGPLLYERTRFGSPFALKQSISAASMDPGANFLLTTHSDRHALGVLQIDALSGAIREIAGSSFALNAGITKAVIHQSGNYVYVFDQSAAKLFTYSRDAVSGAINVEPTSSLDLADKAITAMSIHKDFMYLADESTNKLLIYSVDPGSGALHRVTQVQLPNKTDSIVVTTVN
jgi:6-phosphogluconolactonase (cycloisomerase 2 family)